MPPRKPDPADTLQQEQARLEKALRDNAPWKPPHAELSDMVAMQALANGVADKDQQRIALDWILKRACGINDWSYRPGADDRDTNIALGRQFVGHQIVKLIKINVAKLRGGNHEQG